MQCRIFSLTYNPERLRTGNKVLRQRLRGPSVVTYYPKKGPSLRDLRNAYPGLETWDDDEEDRLEHIVLYGIYFVFHFYNMELIISTTEQKQEGKEHLRRRDPPKVLHLSSNL